ncbi:MAG: VOC family protein [Pseudomonadota bacterium]
MNLGAAPVQAFIPISNSDRARAFYQDVLGLILREDTPFALVFETRAGDLRCAKTPAFTPQPFTIVGWAVPDIAVDMATLSSRQVTFERFDGLPQDDAGIWTTPDGAQICWFKDPDGNLLSLVQHP